MQIYLFLSSFPHRSFNICRGYRMTHNGPAIWGGCVTRRNSGQSRFPESGCNLSLAGKGGYGTRFCRHGRNLIAYWRDRGTNYVEAANLSPVTNLVAGTGAVSRYKVDRSQKTVKVYWSFVASRCACPGTTTITNLS